jgi:hypothetical protein
MTEAELVYFVHSVDGARYGAWYRVVSPYQLEVIGVGMLETVEFAGYSPESSAKSVLENFVRMQKSMGIEMPTLEDDPHDEPPADDAHHHTFQGEEERPRMSRRG